MPALAQALKGQDADIRRVAADALVRIGPAALPALAQALTDQAGYVRRYAADVIEWIIKNLNICKQDYDRNQFFRWSRIACTLSRFLRQMLS